jgi:hypothetical protein
MDEPVFSELSNFYHVRAIGAIIMQLGFCGVCIFISVFNNEKGSDLVITILTCIILIAFICYTLVKKYYILMVNTDEIVIKYYFTGKRVDVVYDDIKEVGTYREKDTSAFGRINYQDFVIELNDGQSIKFNAGDYDNYDQLKAAIYKYKLGIGL